MPYIVCEKEMHFQRTHYIIIIVHKIQTLTWDNVETFLDRITGPIAASLYPASLHHFHTEMHIFHIISPQLHSIYENTVTVRADVTRNMG